MYSNGRGVPKDEVVAVNWFRKSADQGNAQAQRNLGSMYEYGRGVPKSETEAVNWYRKSADQEMRMRREVSASCMNMVEVYQRVR